MTKEQFSQWLQAYGDAWEQSEPDSIVKIFSPHTKYFETPFVEPLVGHAALHEYWAKGARDSQTDITFSAESLFVGEYEGFAHWRASFTRKRNGRRVHLDGTLKAKFDDNLQCTEFREWWHRKET